MSEQTVKQEGEFKIKRKTPKKLATPENNVTKVSMKEPLINTEPEVTKVVIKEDDAPAIEKPVAEVVEDNSPIQLIEEIEEDVKEEVKEVEAEYKEAIRDEKVIGKSLPENIEKLVSFMEETGGNISDYVRLNADYSNVDNETLLKEYYKQTKPYLEGEDISLMLEDFSYDEDIDEQRDIRKKKLAFKEEVAKARNFLEETKSKYYDEIKLRPGVTQEQKKATDFFNRYNENQKLKADKHKQFVDKTKDYFTKDFKGFEFNLGDSKFKYNINNTEEVINQQSDLAKFVGKFLDEQGRIEDHEGYHKAMYAARNADTIAKHFYEQGKSDGIKNIVNKSKNIETASRPQNSEDLFINGFKVKAISGVDSAKLKIKTKQK
mgnify:CR=1 FL=1